MVIPAAVFAGGGGAGGAGGAATFLKFAPFILSGLSSLSSSKGSGGKKGGQTQASIPSAFLPLLQGALGTQQFGLNEGLNAQPGQSFFNLGNAVNQGARFQRQTGQGISRGFPGTLGQSFDTFNQGLRGELAPNILNDVETRLRPGLNRAFDQGEASIFGSAARAGTTRSSGTIQDVSTFRTDLENNLQNTLGGIESSLAPIELQQRFQGAGQGLSVLPGAFQNFMNSPIDRALQESQFARSLPGQTTGAVGQFLNGFPVVEPQQTGKKGGGGGKGK
jgi:hypothetical protein